MEIKSAFTPRHLKLPAATRATVSADRLQVEVVVAGIGAAQVEDEPIHHPEGAHMLDLVAIDDRSKIVYEDVYERLKSSKLELTCKLAPTCRLRCQLKAANVGVFRCKIKNAIAHLIVCAEELSDAIQLICRPSTML